MRQILKAFGLGLYLFLASAETSIGQAGSSQTTEMRALEDILNEELSLATSAIMLERCRSLYVVIGNWLDTQVVTEDIKRVSENYDKTSNEMLRYWLGIAERTLKGDQETHLELFRGKKDIIMDAYFKRMSNAKVLMGSVFEDTIVKTDLGVCKQYESVLGKALERG